jgi:hypothetical protein
MIKINENILKLAVQEAKDEFESTKVQFLDFASNSMREVPLIKWNNYKYFLDHLEYDETIIEGRIKQIETDIASAMKNPNNPDHLMKLITAKGTQNFILSISEKI